MNKSIPQYENNIFNIYLVCLGVLFEKENELFITFLFHLINYSTKKYCVTQSKITHY